MGKNIYGRGKDEKNMENLGKTVKGKEENIHRKKTDRKSKEKRKRGGKICRREKKKKMLQRQEGKL